MRGYMFPSSTELLCHFDQPEILLKCPLFRVDSTPQIVRISHSDLLYVVVRSFFLKTLFNLLPADAFHFLKMDYLVFNFSWPFSGYLTDSFISSNTFERSGPFEFFRNSLPWKTLIFHLKKTIFFLLGPVFPEILSIFSLQLFFQ